MYIPKALTDIVKFCTGLCFSAIYTQLEKWQQNRFFCIQSIFIAHFLFLLFSFISGFLWQPIYLEQIASLNKRYQRVSIFLSVTILENLEISDNI